MARARTLLVAGTASHAGKSTVAAGLCRAYADRGVDVAPFKAQNMSNNARAVPSREGYGEVGVSQWVQARAARVPAHTDHNPVLLKPRGAGESQLVIDGRAVGTFAAGNYYADHWERAREAAAAAHTRLAARHDLVVAEGAGSIAEINLHDRDLANVETARFADADVLLVADIERGGVFASILGTLELLPDDVRARVVGVAITKFRGDASLLESGIEAIEARTGVPVLAVLPYDDPGLPAEDSVSLPPVGERAVWGADDGVSDAESVTVAAVRLPRISNATDLGPLAAEPGVRVAWVPLSSPLEADAVVVPGTKNTVDDLLAAREAGLPARLRAFDGPVVGLCGGYQFLGERLLDADREGTGPTAEVEGVGLLPVETRFAREKAVAPVTRTLRAVGPFGSGGRALGEVRGYEIHLGRSRLLGATDRPLDGDGAVRGNVAGTYLHGLFENRIARDAFLETVFAAAGRSRPAAASEGSPYDRARDLVAPLVAALD
jgi:adenosylcobyric acid synthase